MDRDFDKRTLEYSELYVDLFQLGWKAIEKYGHNFHLPVACFCKEPDITVDFLHESINSKLDRLSQGVTEDEAYAIGTIREGVPLFIKTMSEIVLPSNIHTMLRYREDFLLRLGIHSYCLVLYRMGVLTNEGLRSFVVGPRLSGIPDGMIPRIQESCLLNPCDLWDKLTRIIEVSNIRECPTEEVMNSGGGDRYKRMW